jgi:hypothetical protein
VESLIMQFWMVLWSGLSRKLIMVWEIMMDCR